MASLDFPTNPTDQQTYTLNGITYQYNAAIGAWLTVVVGSQPVTLAANTQVLYSNNGLISGSSGLVFNNSANTLYANTINVSSNMRVYGNLQVGSGTVTITNNSIEASSIIVAGSAIPSGNAANLAYATANAGFAKANAALANTTGTFAGSLTTTGDVTSGGTLQALSTVQSSSGADLSLNANGANRDVILKVNATELARLVGSTGKLGIGTTSPAHKLHVANGNMAVTSSTGAGQISITDDSDSGRGLLLKSNHSGTSNTYVGTNSSIKNLIFGIDQIERMRIDISGRVTTPYQPYVLLAIPGTSGSTVGSTDGSTKILLRTDTTWNGIYTLSVLDNSQNYWNGYQFTCPVAGMYQVAISGIGYPQAGAMHIDLYQNGGHAHGGNARVRVEETASYNQYGATTLIKCSANDTLSWYAFGGKGWHGGHGIWSIRLIG